MAEPSAEEALQGTPAATIVTVKRDNHTPSCAVCQRRKVKCNRLYPCAPCQKTGLQCEYKPVPQQHGRKRVKRSHNDDGGEPLSRTVSGPDPPHSQTLSAVLRDAATSSSAANAPDTARLVSDGGGYRYVNNHLWNAISAQTSSGATPTAGPPSARRESSHRPADGRSGNSVYESAEIAGTHQQNGRPPYFNAARHFVFGRPQSDRFQATQTSIQPPANHIIQLWQTYLTNVDPIMKVFHAPTVQQTVLGQIGTPGLTLNFQALTSAIYFIASVSLQDDESEALLRISRSNLISQYRYKTEVALSAADFVISTDLTVLQAFVLYLAALRSLGETSTVWSLAGLAIRVAGTIGLARDGSVLELPPFECEVRRRLWWALIYLDARNAEVVGQDGDLLVQKYDVRLPANVNDSQLCPDMHNLPESKPGATEISYVLLRALLASGMNSMTGIQGAAGIWQHMRSGTFTLSEKADMLEELERRFDEQILSFCDPTIPLQAFTLNAAQTFLTKMRLIGNIPPDRDPATAGSTDGYSENLFQLSEKMMQLQLDLFNNPSMQKWRWHWQYHFQWYALAELIRQARLRDPGLATLRAWSMIRNIFDDVLSKLALAPQKSPLLDALRTLLNAASSGEDASHNAAQASSDAHQMKSPPLNDALSHKQPYTMAIAGHGSRPHNALLPAMDTDPALTAGEEAAGPCAYDDPGLELDFDAIDWAEFDRLTAELCSK